MDLKTDIRDAVEKFANDSGYSHSIVEPYAVVIANLIDILGDTKYRELATLVYKISTNLAQPGQSPDAESGRGNTGTGAPKLSLELKAEIIELIRAELGRTIAAEEPQPVKPVDNTEPAVNDTPVIPVQNTSDEPKKKAAPEASV